MATKAYKLAICLFNDANVLDYQGPIELLTLVTTENREKYREVFKVQPDCDINPTFLGPTLDPVKPVSGARMIADRTYDDVGEGEGEQFDIILIPGGPSMMPHTVPEPLMKFLKRQAPGAKYILTVCTGAVAPVMAGLLDGEKATTNKCLFKVIQEMTKDIPVTWVPKARWVVTKDKKIWTASGLTAGADMAAAFLEHLVSKEWADWARAFIEMSTRKQEDDEWAAYWGLV